MGKVVVINFKEHHDIAKARDAFMAMWGRPGTEGMVVQEFTSRDERELFWDEYFKTTRTGPQVR